MTKVRAFLKRLEPWQGLLAIVVTLVGGYFAVSSWIRSTAQSAVLDEKFLATLASRVRPMCIFNSEGAIEVDLGAMEYIEGITVTPAPKEYGYEVLIKAKRHLAYAPLLSGVDVSLYPATVSRRPVNDWHYLLSPRETSTGLISEEGTDYIVAPEKPC